MVVDFQYNYYRNKFSYEHGYARKRLSSVVDGVEVDTTYMYMTLKDIESYRESLLVNKDGTTNEVYVSIVADSKHTERKELDKDYKSNRGGKLDADDFESIERTLNTLRNIGYNVYKEDGYEADDLIRELVLKTKDSFDLTIIYTNDSDVLVNLDDTVGVNRFKSNLRKHTLITKDNFSQIMGAEFKCDMPYNCIMLYKCLVGDKSDKIAGVKGFGVKAFDRAVAIIRENVGDAAFEKMTDAEYVDAALVFLANCGRLSDIQIEEARHSLQLVQFKSFEGELKEPELLDNDEKRHTEYGKYSMFSLCK